MKTEKMDSLKSLGHEQQAWKMSMMYRIRMTCGFVTLSLVFAGVWACLVVWQDPVLFEVQQIVQDVDIALRSTLLEKAIRWTGSDQTAESLLQDIRHYDSFILVTKGLETPERRKDEQPFLSVGPGVALPVDVINSAAMAVEVALGRKLFPMHIEAVDMQSHLGLISGVVRPYAVWEVGSGRVLVDATLARVTWRDDKVHYMTGALAKNYFSAVANALSSTAAMHMSSVLTEPSLGSILQPALAVAVAAAFATAPPLWFCIACPAVLGLLAPLVINIGLNQIAAYLCTSMQLPDDQCFDLLMGALGLGFVLSLASAIPIFLVCQLQQCAHRDGRGAASGRRSMGLGKVLMLGRRWGFAVNAGGGGIMQ